MRSELADSVLAIRFDTLTLKCIAGPETLRFGGESRRKVKRLWSRFDDSACDSPYVSPRDSPAWPFLSPHYISITGETPDLPEFNYLNRVAFTLIRIVCRFSLRFTSPSRKVNLEVKLQF